MSGLSIGKNRASRFCQAAPAFAIPAKTRIWEKYRYDVLSTACLNPCPAANAGSVFALILISLPLTGLRPARALRLRGRNVPKPTTVTRLPFATLATIASNTAFTASPAATLLRLPAFAATWTRSDLVTTCDIVSLPLRACVFELALIVSKPNWKDNQLAHAAAQSIYDYAQRRIHHAAIAHACAGGARCRRARDHSPGTRPDHTHLLELGAADAPP